MGNYNTLQWVYKRVKSCLVMLTELKISAPYTQVSLIYQFFIQRLWKIGDEPYTKVQPVHQQIWYYMFAEEICHVAVTHGANAFMFYRFLCWSKKDVAHWKLRELLLVYKEGQAHDYVQAFAKPPSARKTALQLMAVKPWDCGLYAIRVCYSSGEECKEDIPQKAVQWRKARLVRISSYMFSFRLLPLLKEFAVPFPQLFFRAHTEQSPGLHY